MFYLGLYVGLVGGVLLGMMLFCLLSANRCVERWRDRRLEKQLEAQWDRVRRLTTALEKMEISRSRLAWERDELRDRLTDLRAEYSILAVQLAVQLEALQAARKEQEAERRTELVEA